MKIPSLKPMAQVFFIKRGHFRFSHLLTPNVLAQGREADLPAERPAAAAG